MSDDERPPPPAAAERSVRRTVLLAAVVAACAVAGCARRGPIDRSHVSEGSESGEPGAFGRPNRYGEYTDFGLIFKPPPAFRHTDYGMNGRCFGTDQPAVGLCVKPILLADWSRRRFDDITRWDAEMVDPEHKTGPIAWDEVHRNRSGLRTRQTNVFTNSTELGHHPAGHGWAAVVENGEGAAISFALHVAEGADPACYVDAAREMVAAARPAGSLAGR
jgi:hypothetical protein